MSELAGDRVIRADVRVKGDARMCVRVWTVGEMNE